MKMANQITLRVASFVGKESQDFTISGLFVVVHESLIVVDRPFAKLCNLKIFWSLEYLESSQLQSFLNAQYASSGNQEDPLPVVELKDDY